ncbi:MAG: hypothetical protein ABJA87_11680 [bacterium]
MTSSLEALSLEAPFVWDRHPQSAAEIDRLIGEAVTRSPQLGALAERLATETSTRVTDWLDSVSGPVDVQELIDLGFVEGHRTAPGVWRHPGAQLPAVIPAAGYRLGLRVDDAAAFAQAQRSAAPVAGSPLSGVRAVEVITENDVTVLGVERRSWASGLVPTAFDAEDRAAAAEAWRTLAERPRALTGADGVRAQRPAVQAAVALVGPDLAASYFLQLERQYWQRSNLAGLRQHARQDRLGLGWGNNDHHTFRSSRAAFAGLIELLTALGFELRERFYAGAEAGWGAQVLEHPGCAGVIFADVDLTPAEVEIDFAHAALTDVDGPDAEFGTVGMWCALHGESVLEAGMHHLEGQFDFDGLRTDLAADGIASMRPFSDFDHLRQAFTEAEVWPVPRERVEKLAADGHLDPRRADELIRTGAAGSHLENLARRDGFKGFNQHNVSVTMKATHIRDYSPV